MKRFSSPLLYVGVALSFFGCAGTVRPPLPQQGILTAPQRNASHIAIPVSLDLNALAHDLEKSIDGGALGSETQKEAGINWSMGAQRLGPVRLVVRGNTLHCEIPLQLQAKGSGSGRLSMVKTPPVEFNLPLAFDIPIPKPSQGTLDLKVPAVNLPELPGVLRKSKLAQRLSGKDAQSLSALVEKTLQAPLQKKLEELWASLQKPLPVGSEGFLALRPDTLAFLGAQSPDSSRLELGFGMVSAVRFSTRKPADQPASRFTLATIPNWSPSVHIQLPLQASWQSLQQRAGQELVGKKLAQGKRWLRIDGVELGGIQTTDAAGGNANGVRLSLAFTAETDSWFAGKQTGTLHFTAYPCLDTATQTFSLSGFALTSDTRSLLLDKGLEWAIDLGYEQILARANLDLGKQLKAPLATLNTQLRQGFPAGPLRLHGNIQAVRFAGLYLDDESLEPWFTLDATFSLNN